MFKEDVIKVANRCKELIKESFEAQEKLKILLEVANIKCTEEGDSDSSPIYEHRDFQNIEFYSEDGDTISVWDKGKDNLIESHSEMPKLKKICKFLEIYEELMTKAFLNQIISEDDPDVGKLIQCVIEDMEVSYEIKLKHWYGMEVPYGFDKIEEISVYHIKEEKQYHEGFWKEEGTIKAIKQNDFQDKIQS